MSRLELSIGAAKAEYDKIKAANLSETARFAAERRAEYLQMLENFTATQVRPALTHTAKWEFGSMWHQTKQYLAVSRPCARGSPQTIVTEGPTAAALEGQ